MAIHGIGWELTCTVNEHVKLAELGNGGLHATLYRRVAGHVRLHEHDSVAFSLELRDGFSTLKLQ
jgi:hypothetical protein